MAKANTNDAGFFPQLYKSAVQQTGDDYDSISNQYKTLGSSVRNTDSDLTYSPIAPTMTTYQPGSDYSYLRDFVNTGGFSEGDVNNIRARAISPIRSIYASAQRGVDRAKNISGGYMPNYGAITSKMARESSNLISDRTTDANAAIAQMVQQGKLAGATSLAPIEARENELKNKIAELNATVSNNFAMFNKQNEMDVAKSNRADDDNDFSKILSTIQGQQSLYGTTPALASTFGNQAISAANTMNSSPITPSKPLPIYNPYSTPQFALGRTTYSRGY